PMSLRHRRQPRSFPTRRSSDLLLRLHPRRVEDEQRAVGEEGALLRVDGDELGARRPGLLTGVEDAIGVALVVVDDRLLLDGDRRDRKSTRLNSSHQIISYSVFC